MDSIIEEARRQLVALDVKRSKLLKIIEIAESLGGIDSPTSPGPIVKDKVVEGDPSSVMWQTREAVRSILKERGSPVRLSDLLREVQGRGVKVGGKNPMSTFAARLSNSSEFESIRGRGWWFSNQPLPESESIFEEAESTPQERLSASNPK